MTTLTIDDALLEEVIQVGEFSSEREAVNTVLSEWLQKYRAKQLIKMFGTIEYDDNYSYKNERQRDIAGIIHESVD